MVAIMYINKQVRRNGCGMKQFEGVRNEYRRSPNGLVRIHGV